MRELIEELERLRLTVQGDLGVSTAKEDFDYHSEALDSIDYLITYLS